MNLFDQVGDLVSEYQLFLSEKLLSKTTPIIDLVGVGSPFTFKLTLTPVDFTI